MKAAILKISAPLLLVAMVLCSTSVCLYAQDKVMHLKLSNIDPGALKIYYTGGPETVKMPDRVQAVQHGSGYLLPCYRKGNKI